MTNWAQNVSSNCHHHLHHHHHHPNHHHHYNYGHNWQQRCPLRCVTFKFTTTRCPCPPFYRYPDDHRHAMIAIIITNIAIIVTNIAIIVIMRKEKRS